MKIFLKWTGGAFVAGLLLVLIGGEFLDMHPAEYWDSARKTITRPEGCRVVWRSEGRATSFYGCHGINVYEDATTLEGDIVLLWGDSHVEAFQVSDDKKMAQVITRLARGNGSNLYALGMGRSAATVADHFFDMPHHEELFSPVVHHIIIVNSVDRLLPNTKQRRAKFLSHPELHFEPSSQQSLSKSREFLTGLLGKYRLQTLLEVKLLILGASAGTVHYPLWDRMRFSVGPMKKDTSALFKEKIESPPMEESLRFALASIQQQTDQPVTVVYSPTVPRLEGGEVLYTDEDEQKAVALKAACAAEGIGFVDMGSDYIEYFRSEGRFPRGFPNSRLGEGHINEAGHRLIAEKILEVLI